MHLRFRRAGFFFLLRETVGPTFICSEKLKFITFTGRESTGNISEEKPGHSFRARQAYRSKPDVVNNILALFYTMIDHRSTYASDYWPCFKIDKPCYKNGRRNGIQTCPLNFLREFIWKCSIFQQTFIFQIDVMIPNSASQLAQNTSRRVHEKLSLILRSFFSRNFCMNIAY